MQPKNNVGTTIASSTRSNRGRQRSQPRFDREAQTGRVRVGADVMLESSLGFTDEKLSGGPISNKDLLLLHVVSCGP